MIRKVVEQIAQWRDQGVRLVPVSVNISNYEEILVGSGYYTADQLK